MECLPVVISASPSFEMEANEAPSVINSFTLVSLVLSCKPLKTIFEQIELIFGYLAERRNPGMEESVCPAKRRSQVNSCCPSMTATIWRMNLEAALVEHIFMCAEDELGSIALDV